MTASSPTKRKSFSGLSEPELPLWIDLFNKNATEVTSFKVQVQGPTKPCALFLFLLERCHHMNKHNLTYWRTKTTWRHARPCQLKPSYTCQHPVHLAVGTPAIWRVQLRSVESDPEEQNCSADPQTLELNTQSLFKATASWDCLYTAIATW